MQTLIDTYGREKLYLALTVGMPPTFIAVTSKKPNI